MNNNIKNGLEGTKTGQNLRTAAANEALAHVKYTLFSDIASEAGQMEAARMFNEMASHEKEHAELWLSYLDELSDTEDNLDRSIRGESYEANESYPEYSRIAAEEGFSELSDKFRMAATAEGGHAERYSELSERMADGSMYTGDADTTWYCTNCGYRTKGNMPPERCPLCSYPKGYFSKTDM